jgi:hypothetical protein
METLFSLLRCGLAIGLFVIAHRAVNRAEVISLVGEASLAGTGVPRSSASRRMELSVDHTPKA